jgi:hypothetical protein
MDRNISSELGRYSYLMNKRMLTKVISKFNFLEKIEMEEYHLNDFSQKIFFLRTISIL